MHLVLAALGAFSLGAGDVAGGVASRRDRFQRVAALNFGAGATLVAVAAVIVGHRPDQPIDAGWAAVSGIGSAVAISFLYRGFERAPMGIVSPVAAVVGTAVPVVAGLVTGERPDPAVAVGLAVAIVAIVVLSRGSAEGGSSVAGGASAMAGVVHGVGAGLGFGLLLMGLAVADGGALGLVAISRGASFVALVGQSMVVGSPLRGIARGARLPTVVTGIATTAATVLYFLATEIGSLIESTAVYSLFPAATLLVARVTLGERLGSLQLIGVTLAVAAGVLLAVA